MLPSLAFKRRGTAPRWVGDAGSSRSSSTRWESEEKRCHSFVRNSSQDSSPSRFLEMEESTECGEAVAHLRQLLHQPIVELQAFDTGCDLPAEGLVASGDVGNLTGRLPLECLGGLCQGMRHALERCPERAHRGVRLVHASASSEAATSSVASSVNAPFMSSAVLGLERRPAR